MNAAVRARPTITLASSSGRIRAGRACLINPTGQRQSDRTAVKRVARSSLNCGMEVPDRGADRPARCCSPQAEAVASQDEKQCCEPASDAEERHRDAPMALGLVRMIRFHCHRLASLVPDCVADADPTNSCAEFEVSHIAAIPPQPTSNSKSTLEFESFLRVAYRSEIRSEPSIKMWRISESLLSCQKQGRQTIQRMSREPASTSDQGISSHRLCTGDLRGCKAG